MKTYQSINQHNANNAKNHFRKAWNENKQSPESFYDFVLSDKNKWLSKKIPRKIKLFVVWVKMKAKTAMADRREKQ